MLGLAASWIGLLFGIGMAWPYNAFFFPEQGIAYAVASANVFFLLGIPLFSIVAVLLRIISKKRILQLPRIKTGGFWVLNLICLLGLLSFFAVQFKTDYQLPETISLNPVNNETLFLEFPEQHLPHRRITVDELDLSESLLKSKMVELDIVNADALQLSIEKSARGKEVNDAKESASTINYNITQTENKIVIPADFSLRKGEKWRVQKIKVRLGIPVGQKVSIPKDHPGYLINGLPSEETELWTMTTNGLRPLNTKSTEIIGEKSKFRIFDEFQNFDQIEIDGPIKVNIENREDWAFRMSGLEVYTEKVTVEQTGNILKITGNFTNPEKPVRVYINMPSLTDLKVENTDDVKIKGFDQPRMSISNFGDYDVKAHVNVDSLFLQQNGRNEIDLRGKGRFLSANLTEKSRLDAENYLVDITDITADDESQVKLLNEVKSR